MAGNIRPSGDGYLVGTFTVADAAVSRGQFVSFYTPDNTVRACNASSAPFGVALTDGDVGDRIVRHPDVPVVTHQMFMNSPLPGVSAASVPCAPTPPPRLSAADGGRDYARLSDVVAGSG